MKRSQIRHLANERRAEQQPTTTSLLAGTIELTTGDDYRVRLLGGELLSARAAPGCSPELLDECLRDRRTVLLTACDKGPMILGAIQTTPSVMTSRDGVGAAATRRLELVADEAIVLHVGGSHLELRADGSLRLAGQRLSIDISSIVKVLSARVELP